MEILVNKRIFLVVWSGNCMSRVEEMIILRVFGGEIEDGVDLRYRI